MQAERDLPSFNQHNMVSLGIKGSLEGTDILAFFNNQPFHTPPLALALADIAVVRAVTNNKNFTITTSNHPLPRTDIEKVSEGFWLTLVTLKYNKTHRLELNIRIWEEGIQIFIANLKKYALLCMYILSCYQYHVTLLVSFVPPICFLSFPCTFSRFPSFLPLTYILTAVSCPQQLTQDQRQNLGFQIGFNLAFGMSFLAASFVIFLIQERSSEWFETMVIMSSLLIVNAGISKVMIF